LTRLYAFKYTALMKTSDLTFNDKCSPNKKPSFSLESKLLLRKNREDFLSPKKVQLLENITIYGSISKAAKASEITYKTAWTWIDKMNSLAPKALVEKISGGKGGGGTLVTAYAKELICLYEEVEALHNKHLNTLERAFDHLEDEKIKGFSFSRLNAEVVEISKHEKRATLRLKLGCGSSISAQAPVAFVEVNKLKPASMLYVLVESQAVSVSKSFEKESSSRNKLQTKVVDVMIHGEDVVLTLSLGNSEMLTSQITYQSYQSLDIKKEDELWVMFKAYSITLLKRGE